MMIRIEQVQVKLQHRLQVKQRNCVVSLLYGFYSVSQKVAPLNLFAIFSLTEKFSWLLPNHITTDVPILVHLYEYLCELSHFC